MARRYFVLVQIGFRTTLVLIVLSSYLRHASLTDRREEKQINPEKSNQVKGETQQTPVDMMPSTEIEPETAEVRHE